MSSILGDILQENRIGKAILRNIQKIAGNREGDCFGASFAPLVKGEEVFGYSGIQ